MVTGSIVAGFRDMLDVYLLDALADKDHGYVFLFILFMAGLGKLHYIICSYLVAFPSLNIPMLAPCIHLVGLLEKSGGLAMCSRGLLFCRDSYLL